MTYPIRQIPTNVKNKDWYDRGFESGYELSRMGLRTIIDHMTAASARVRGGPCLMDGTDFAMGWFAGIVLGLEELTGEMP